MTTLSPAKAGLVAPLVPAVGICTRIQVPESRVLSTSEKYSVLSSAAPLAVVAVKLV
jgi:hypothetical protein